MRGIHDTHFGDAANVHTNLEVVAYVTNALAALVDDDAYTYDADYHLEQLEETVRSWMQTDTERRILIDFLALIRRIVTDNLDLPDPAVKRRPTSDRSPQ